jgi:hypothetical protein
MYKTRGIVATLFGAWMIAAGAYGDGPQSSSAEATRVRVTVTQMGELGEDIYDFANDNDWTRLYNRLDSLNKIVDSLRPEARENEDARVQLDHRITDLEEAAAARDPLGAMQAGNRITLIAADLSEQFHPQVPADVARLDYYGRELQIDSQEKDLTQLQETTNALLKTWNRLRPDVVKHGGTAQAQRFDALVQRLKEAKSSDQYSTLVMPILDEVDSLEKLFSK